MNSWVLQPIKIRNDKMAWYSYTQNIRIKFNTPYHMFDLCPIFLYIRNKKPTQKVV